MVENALALGHIFNYTIWGIFGHGMVCQYYPIVDFPSHWPVPSYEMRDLAHKWIVTFNFILLNLIFEYFLPVCTQTVNVQIKPNKTSHKRSYHPWEEANTIYAIHP